MKFREQIDGKKGAVKLEIFFDAEEVVEANNYKDVIVGTIAEVMKSEGFGNAGVDVMLTDNSGIRELNRQFRQIDRETDCLSFPQYEKPQIDVLNKSKYHMLGDVVISYEKAVSQAEEYGHSTKRELAFLSAHSALHLLGYDHETDAEEMTMFEKQEQVLTRLNYLR